MKRKLLVLCSCFLFAVILVCGLYFLTDKINNNKNNFIRKFPSHVIKSRRVIDLKYNSYYIAGLDDNHIYIGNFINRTTLIKTDYSLSDTEHIDFSFLKTDTLKFQPFKFIVADSNVYIINERTSEIFYTQLNQHLVKRYQVSGKVFNALIPVSNSEVIYRTFNPALNNNVLIGQSIDSSIQYKGEYKIQGQGDGFFSTDGLLRFNKPSDYIVYVYYYRNQFLCLDRNLNLVFQQKTIDTTNVAKLKIEKIPSQHIYKLAAPPMIINKYACTSGNWLFINSSLLADNENKDDFATNSVIDMYALKERRYFYSFYIPDIEKKKITDLSVYNNHCVVINNRYLAVYELAF